MLARGLLIKPTFGFHKSNRRFLYRAYRLATSSQKTHRDGFLYSLGEPVEDEERIRCQETIVIQVKLSGRVSGPATLSALASGTRFRILSEVTYGVPGTLGSYVWSHRNSVSRTLCPRNSVSPELCVPGTLLQDKTGKGEPVASLFPFPPSLSKKKLSNSPY